METDFKVLGIDPALGTTGYGLLRSYHGKVEMIDAGVIRAARSDALENRLQEIFDGVLEVLTEHKPNYFAMEQLYSHYERPRTAILMGHARGVICLAAAKAGLNVNSYEPTKVKKLLTGNGRAPKAQMQLAVQQQLRLAKPIEPSDVADALAIALCHVQALKMPSQLAGIGPTNVLDQLDVLQRRTRKL